MERKKILTTMARRHLIDFKLGIMDLKWQLDRMTVRTRGQIDPELYQIMRDAGDAMAEATEKLEFAYKVAEKQDTRENARNDDSPVSGATLKDSPHDKS